MLGGVPGTCDQEHLRQQVDELRARVEGTAGHQQPDRSAVLVYQLVDPVLELAVVADGGVGEFVVDSNGRRNPSALAVLSIGRTAQRICPERASIRSTRLKSQRA